MKVKYTGDSDAQTFDAADFKKGEVEGKKTRFPKDEVVEVSDEVGQALTGNEGIFGPYSFEEVTEDEDTSTDSTDEAIDADVDPELPAEGKAAKTEGTADATTTTGTGRSTGRGSSTRTR